MFVLCRLDQTTTSGTQKARGLQPISRAIVVGDPQYAITETAMLVRVQACR